MKRLSKVIVLIAVLFCTLNKTIAYYNTNTSLINSFVTQKYNLKIDGNGGTFNEKNIIVKNNKTILPIPQKLGYDFLGYKDDNNTSYSTSVNDVNSINNKKLSATWSAISYSISYNLNGGTLGQTDVINEYNIEATFTLPIPEKKGYSFTGWTGTGLNTPTKTVTISGSIGNRSYTANWSKNNYTVNYYVNGTLWTQRTVGYNEPIENLNAQGILDIYHTFHGWTNWVDRMPNYNINLYANITESYCQLSTGHGPWGNAEGLLRVFQNAGWSGRIVEASTAPGNYMVVTDYTLTRAQAEVQKNYIAANTNYRNYNFPYLYWVGVNCTNGYSSSWTRPRGQSWFN